MKTRFILFRRAGIFYCEDTATKKQLSLKTKIEAEAQALLAARNESFRQPHLNLHIARTYLTATDPEIARRTWQAAMDAMGTNKTGATRIRHDRAMQSRPSDGIRRLPILETQATHLMKVLETGGVSTHVFLRRLHNFALDMSWLPWPILAKKQWPKLRFKEKRAVTTQEHEAIITTETNPERRAFYACCWHLGGAQTDVASLRAEDIDWQNHIVSFRRRKTSVVSIIRFGDDLAEILSSLPPSGPLFPKLQPMREAHRATEFRRACRRLGIKGITLHSYRYAWAERARACGYPERFAQEALGHNSKSVHRAYARNAHVVIPTLEDFERKISAAEPVIDFAPTVG